MFLLKRLIVEKKTEVKKKTKVEDEQDLAEYLNARRCNKPIDKDWEKVHNKGLGKKRFKKLVNVSIMLERLKKMALAGDMNDKSIDLRGMRGAPGSGGKKSRRNSRVLETILPLEEMSEEEKWRKRKIEKENERKKDIREQYIKENAGNKIHAEGENIKPVVKKIWKGERRPSCDMTNMLDNYKNLIKEEKEPDEKDEIKEETKDDEEAKNAEEANTDENMKEENTKQPEEDDPANKADKGNESRSSTSKSMAKCNIMEDIVEIQEEKEEIEKSDDDKTERKVTDGKTDQVKTVVATEAAQPTPRKISNNKTNNLASKPNKQDTVQQKKTPIWAGGTKDKKENKNRENRKKKEEIRRPTGRSPSRVHPTKNVQREGPSTRGAGKHLRPPATTTKPPPKQRLNTSERRNVATDKRKIVSVKIKEKEKEVQNEKEKLEKMKKGISEKRRKEKKAPTKEQDPKFDEFVGWLNNGNKDDYGKSQNILFDAESD